MRYSTELFTDSDTSVRRCGDTSGFRHDGRWLESRGVIGIPVSLRKLGDRDGPHRASAWAKRNRRSNEGGLLEDGSSGSGPQLRPSRGTAAGTRSRARNRSVYSERSRPTQPNGLVPDDMGAPTGRVEDNS